MVWDIQYSVNGTHLSSFFLSFFLFFSLFLFVLFCLFLFLFLFSLFFFTTHTGVAILITLVRPQQWHYNTTTMTLQQKYHLCHDIYYCKNGYLSIEYSLFKSDKTLTSCGMYFLSNVCDFHIDISNIKSHIIQNIKPMRLLCTSLIKVTIPS